MPLLILMNSRNKFLNIIALFIFSYIDYEKSSSGLIDETRQEAGEIISPEEMEKLCLPCCSSNNTVHVVIVWQGDMPKP